MKAAIIVISYNHFLFTKACIDSIVYNTDINDYELCLVDNGSVDETKEWANKLCDEGIIDKFISNDKNVGACKASNQGTEWALPNINLTHIVVMANDHILTNNWLTYIFNSPYDCTIPFVFHSVTEVRSLYPKIGYFVEKYKPLRIKHLQVDNEEKMELVLGETYGDFDVFLKNYHLDNIGTPYIKTKRILWPGLIVYKREVLESVGLKDEEFLKYDLASYADIDHYLRVYLAGFSSGVSMLSYVHHWGSITTRKLGLSQDVGGYKNNENKAYKYFVEKWNADPHDLSYYIK